MTGIPRSKPLADFDLMALAPRPCDRSGRVDDLYLFLEALFGPNPFVFGWVGAASLIIQSTFGLLSQLADYIDRVWGAGTYEGLIQQHPMQPFSTQYFERESAGVNPCVQTFDDRWMKRSDITSPAQSSTMKAKL